MGLDSCDFARAWGALLNTSVEWNKSGFDLTHTIPLIDEAIAELTTADCNLLKWIAKGRKGKMIGGNEGERLIGQSEAWMNKQGVVNPAQISQLLAPGFE